MTRMQEQAKALELADMDPRTRAALAIAVGGSVTQAARRAGVHRVTVQEWKRETAFQAQVAEYQLEVRGRAKSKLHGLSGLATRVIEQVLRGDIGGKAAAVRVDAAFKVLKAAGIDSGVESTGGLTIVTYVPRPGREAEQPVPGGLTRESIEASFVEVEREDLPGLPAHAVGQAPQGPPADYLRALAEQDPSLRRSYTTGDFDTDEAEELEAQWSNTQAGRRSMMRGSAWDRTKPAGQRQGPKDLDDWGDSS